MDSPTNPPGNEPFQHPSTQPTPQPEPVIMAQPVPIAPQVVIHQHTGGWQRFISWVGWVGLMICIPIIIGMAAAFEDYFNTSGGVREKYHSLSKNADNKIALIELTGIISEGDGFVKKQIERVREDDDVKGIIVRVDSPGGTVSGSDYIYHHLCQLKNEKEVPLVVSMGSMCASGGYYISMAVEDQPQSIYAEPTTTTGSIGVIIPHYDLSGLLARYSIEDDSIVSHPRKQMLSMTRKASEEDRVVLQSYVDQSFERFKGIVRDGRPKFKEDPEALDKLATGEIFTAEQAKENGLVDEIGFIEDAVDRVLELTGLNEDDVRVVRYEQPPNLLDSLSSARVSSSTGIETALLELATPKAYYITTTLPVLFESRP